LYKNRPADLLRIVEAHRSELIYTRTDSGIRDQQLRRTENGRQHHGKRERGSKEVLERRQFTDTHVIPVLNKAIQVFEQPPQDGAQWKQRQEVARAME